MRGHVHHTHMHIHVRTSALVLVQLSCTCIGKNGTKHCLQHPQACTPHTFAHSCTHTHTRSCAAVLHLHRRERHQALLQHLWYARPLCGPAFSGESFKSQGGGAGEWVLLFLTGHNGERVKDQGGGGGGGLGIWADF